MVEVEVVGVLDLPVMDDSVQGHLAKFRAVLGPEIEDFDPHILWPLVLIRNELVP